MACTWPSNVRPESKITQRSLALVTGMISLPRSERRKLGSFALICLLPHIMALTFSGFNSNLLSKHQLRILKSLDLFLRQLFVGVAEKTTLKVLCHRHTNRESIVVELMANRSHKY